MAELMAAAPPVTPEDVAAHIGRDGTGQDGTVYLALATTVVPMVVTMVRSYTRGRGFSPLGGDDETYARDLAAVILTASARTVDNLYRARVVDYSVDSNTMVGWRGFNLAEQTVLNRYRKTAL